MTKHILKFTLFASLAGALAYGQNPLSSTTLSGTITAGTTTVCLASATNVVVPSLSAGVLGSIFVIDNEAMQVSNSGPSSTCFGVKRGLYANSASNAASKHGNGAKVWVMGQSVSTGDPSRPISTSAFLSQRAYQAFEVLSTPTLFGVSTTSVTGVAGKIYYGAIEVDMSTIVTGACLLNGATVTTDKHIVALYDATGTLIANSTLAGLADTGFASQYECQAFTSPVALVGPAQYFVAAQGNGTTDNVQMYATGAAHTSYPTGSQTGVFGTLPAITVTTTFTAAVGPLMTLY